MATSATKIKTIITKKYRQLSKYYDIYMILCVKHYAEALKPTEWKTNITKLIHTKIKNKNKFNYK